jgi:MFS family permease
MVSWIQRTIYPPLIPEMTNDLQLTYTQAGLLMTGFWTGYVITQIPSGYLSDRIGVRRTHAAALTLVGITSIMTGTASSFGDCFTYRILCGLAAGCIFAPGAAIVLRWFQPEERGVASSLFVVGSKVGGIVGLILSPAISAFFGSWRWSFWILSSIAFFAAIAVVLFEKELPEKKNADKRVIEDEEPSTLSKYRTVFENRVILLLLLANVGSHISNDDFWSLSSLRRPGSFGLLRLGNPRSTVRGDYC